MVEDKEDYIRKVYIPMSLLALDDTPITFEGAAKRTVVVNDSETAVEFSDFLADDHSARHEEGGADEVTEITGKLNNHSARHENGGADEISVTGLSGVLADKQDPQAHGARHENGGGDEISVAGLSGDLADAQDPKSHGASHKDGGGDELDAAELAGALGVSGEVLKSNGAAAYWGGVSAGRGQLNTGTGSTSGTANPETGYSITLNPYSFFPMIWADSYIIRLSGHGLSGNVDQPRFSVYNSSSSTYASYGVDWRYVA